MPENNVTALLTYKDAAAILRFNPVTVRRLVSEKKLRHLKIGRAVRFKLEFLYEYSKEVPPAPAEGGRS